MNVRSREDHWHVVECAETAHVRSTASGEPTTWRGRPCGSSINSDLPVASGLVHYSFTRMLLRGHNSLGKRKLNECDNMRSALEQLLALSSAICFYFSGRYDY
jgi:hypothetical protein